MSFYDWLMEQADRDDPIGDLATDTQRVKDAPINSDSLDAWSAFLIRSGASIIALGALEAAWEEYGGPID